MLITIGVIFHMEYKFEMSGWAFSVFGAVSMVGLLYGYFFVADVVSAFGIKYAFILVIMGVSLAVSFMTFLSGIYLLKNNEAVHKVALPISFAIMISVPVGTAVGALYLWQRHESTK